MANELQENLQTILNFVEKYDGGTGIVISAEEPTGENRKKIWFKKSLSDKNLIDLNTFITGWVNGTDGSINSGSDNGIMSSPFIKVTPNTTYTFSVIETTDEYECWLCAGFYDKAKKYIVREANADTTATSITFTTTSETEYIIVSARNLSGATKVQLELGDVTTEYEEHINKVIYVKDDNDEYQVYIGNNIYDNYPTIVKYFKDITWGSTVNNVSVVSSEVRDGMAYLTLNIQFKSTTLSAATYRLVSGIPPIQVFGEFGAFLYKGNSSKSVRIALQPGGHIDWWYNPSEAVNADSVLIVNLVYPSTK